MTHEGVMMLRRRMTGLVALALTDMSMLWGNAGTQII